MDFNKGLGIILRISDEFLERITKKFKSIIDFSLLLISIVPLEHTLTHRLHELIASYVVYKSTQYDLVQNVSRVRFLVVGIVNF